MADRTIGELPAVRVGDLPLAPDIYGDTKIPAEQRGEAKHITGAQWVDYAKAAVKAEVKEAGDFAENAKSSADGAAKSAKAAAESAKDAVDVALHPPILKDGNDHWWVWDTAINDYKDSGIDAGVSVEVVETVTGEPGTAAKVENVGTNTDPQLKFTIPQGVKGNQGGVWVPNVTPEGELSWEKNSGVEPGTVNIKGPKGDPSTVPGPKGDPGVSPAVSVSKEGGTTTVTITDADGPHTAEIKDGEVTQEAMDAALAKKQDALTGIAGQVVGFDEAGKAKAVPLPETGCLITATVESWQETTATIEDQEIKAGDQYVYILALAAESLPDYKSGAIWAEVTEDGKMDLHIGEAPEGPLTFDILRLEAKTSG